METGEIDLIALNSDLLLGWDGMVLRWMLVDGNVVLDFGSEEEPLGFQSLADRYARVRSVWVSLLRPVCSLMPSAVANGIEGEVLKMHHGPSNALRRSYQSERLGEEVTLMESGPWSAGDDFLKSWPHVRWSSCTLGWLELQKRRTIPADCASLLSIDVGLNRALMCRFDEGELAWCMVTEDMQGEGVLYHAVNSMVRSGGDAAAEDARQRTAVVFSGSVESHPGMMKQFTRFFPHVEIEEGALLWKNDPPADVGDWNLLHQAVR